MLKKIDNIHRLNSIRPWPIFLITLFISSELLGGAWVQKKHGYFLKVGVNYLETGTEFDHLGNEKSIFEDLEVYKDTEYEDITVFSYLEYGLFSNFTLVMNLPFKIVNSSRTEVSNYFRTGERQETHTANGFGDLRLGGRFMVFNHPLVVSIQPGVKLPLGYDTSQDREGPALGTGEVDYESQLLLGKSLYPLPIYVTGGFGYRFRNEPLHDEMFFNAEAGLTMGEALIKVSLDGLQNTSTPPDIYGQTVQLPLPGGGGEVPIRLFGDQDFTKLNAGIIYSLRENLAIDASLFHLLSGKNIVTGTTYSLGIVFRN